MGTIIVTKGEEGQFSIIDGQQRLTSLTLLLIALRNLAKGRSISSGLGFEDSQMLIWNAKLNKKNFNLNVPQWKEWFESLVEGKPFNEQDAGESVRNILFRYKDVVDLIEQCFLKEDDTIDADLLSTFNSWLRYRVIFIRIETPSEQDAHKVFVSMNDRGLSLNPSEMLKGYLLSEIQDDKERKEANAICQKTVLALKESEGEGWNGEYMTEDMNFLSAWIRAKYAGSLRPGEKGAKDMDYEIIGREFHEWVRQRHKELGLDHPGDYYRFIQEKLVFFATQYLRIKKFSKEYTPGFEAVFYNADKHFGYQAMLVLAALDEHDVPGTTDRKIQVVSAFFDHYTARRLFNFQRFGWNTVKYEMFSIMKGIRGLSLAKLAAYLTYRLRAMGSKIDGITARNFCWNQFSGRYILHTLARIADYVEREMGNASSFALYVNRTARNAYDREHVLPDKFENYQDSFSSVDEFEMYRARLGNLIPLKADKNRSYQDMPYLEKRAHYQGDNLLAQSFCPEAYQNNPKFTRTICARYPFKPYDSFGKEEIAERQELYRLICRDIYDENALKDIAGSWDEAYYESLLVERLADTKDLDLLHAPEDCFTSTKPLLLKLEGDSIPCSSYVDVVLGTINFLIARDHGKMRELAKSGFPGRLAYVSEDASRELVRNAMVSPKDTDDVNIIANVHGSASELVRFLRSLLAEFGVEQALLHVR